MRLIGYAGSATAGQPVGTLWLVESQGERASERLRSMGSKRWRVEERDAITWDVRRDDGTSVVVVRGRQVVTAEDLEVLLVGTSEAPPDGHPLIDTIDRWIDREVIVMLPWGFGKWSGARGRLAEEAYATFADRGLRLADTGARAAWLATPTLFRRSAVDGYAVLAGSDPFPFPDRVRSVASNGFVLDEVAPGAGWADIRRAVLELQYPAASFGAPLSTPAFLSLQLRMQYRKRFGGGR